MENLFQQIWLTLVQFQLNGADLNITDPKGFAVKKRKCIKAKGKLNWPSIHVNVTLEFCAAKCRKNPR